MSVQIEKKNNNNYFIDKFIQTIELLTTAQLSWSNQKQKKNQMKFTLFCFFFVFYFCSYRSKVDVEEKKRVNIFFLFWFTLFRITFGMKQQKQQQHKLPLKCAKSFVAVDFFFILSMRKIYSKQVYELLLKRKKQWIHWFIHSLTVHTVRLSFANK